MQDDCICGQKITNLLKRLLIITNEYGCNKEGSLHEDEDSAYLVGGFVRDLFIGRHSNDIDVLLLKNVRGIAKEFADQCGGSFVILDSEHHAYRVVFTQVQISIDIVGPKGKGLEEDLMKRDFTVNALAIQLRSFIELCDDTELECKAYEDIVIDVANGMQDIAARRISIVYSDAIVDDPLRILRGVRLAGQVGFTITHETQDLMWRNKHRIKNVSFERIREEFWSIVALEKCEYWLNYLSDDVGVLCELIPQLVLETAPEHNLKTEAICSSAIKRVRDVENLIAKMQDEVMRNEVMKIEVMKNDDMKDIERKGLGLKVINDYLAVTIGGGHTRVPLLKFAMLLKDLHVEQVRKIATRWKLSRKEASVLITWSQWDSSMTSFHDIYETYNVEALGAIMIEYAILDEVSDDCIDYLISYTEYMYRRSQLKQLITGKEIIQGLGVPPGKRVKDLLLLIERSQFDEVVTNKEEAIAYIRTHMKNDG